MPWDNYSKEFAIRMSEVQYVRVCKIDNILCCSPCSGLVVTSYSKYEPSRKLEKEFHSSINQYKKFKKMYEINPDYKGEFSM